jgi:methylated-DNA-[protein]-cysteine S-methyltransferase
MVQQGPPGSDKFEARQGCLYFTGESSPAFAVDHALGALDDKLCLLDFRYRKIRSAVDHRVQKDLQAELVEAPNAILDDTKRQIDEYLHGDRITFNLPIVTVGTTFQKKVWHALMEVPYAQTASYLYIAKKIGDEKAVRAVANANGANALALIIPCHRIIGRDGRLTGYGGGLAVKKRLLDLEKRHVDRSKNSISGAF